MNWEIRMSCWTGFVTMILTFVSLIMIFWIFIKQKSFNKDLNIKNQEHNEIIQLQNLGVHSIDKHYSFLYSKEYFVQIERELELLLLHYQRMKKNKEIKLFEVLSLLLRWEYKNNNILFDGEKIYIQKIILNALKITQNNIWNIEDIFELKSIFNIFKNKEKYDFLYLVRKIKIWIEENKNIIQAGYGEKESSTNDRKRYIEELKWIDIILKRGMNE